MKGARERGRIGIWKKKMMAPEVRKLNMNKGWLFDESGWSSIDWDSKGGGDEA